jgi:hypothetical protein
MANYSKLWQSYGIFWQVVARFGKFKQYLPDSTEVCQEDCVYIYIYTHTLPLKTPTI